MSTNSNIVSSNNIFLISAITYISYLCWPYILTLKTLAPHSYIFVFVFCRHQMLYSLSYLSFKQYLWVLVFVFVLIGFDFHLYFSSSVLAPALQNINATSNDLFRERNTNCPRSQLNDSTFKMFSTVNSEIQKEAISETRIGNLYKRGEKRHL